ncbi:MAG TPA: hypothetical protein PK166_05235 [Candidatus Hydrogenedentes bacterium]|nr:hypothetical protein [Candidatus Hydrogenedentota bacterium]HQH67779.1 hypothetical protein [Candidatus Hydrogenedentota bacterium]HQM48942.1 hypothetical protein [Candidatus Hydrogenedentota bacterium]
MKKEHVIFIGAGILLLAVIGSGYQFYLKPTAALLDEKKKTYMGYSAKLQELEERYGGYVPEDVVSAWTLQLTPWYNTIETRGELFGLGRIVYEEVPTNTLPKFHYAEQYQAMLEELTAEALEKGLTLPPLNFDVPTTQIENTAMTKQEVEYYLREIAIGCSMIRLLLEYDPIAINAMYMWPPREPAARITAVSVGYSFVIKMGKLAEFIDDISSRQRYASIDYYSIVNEDLLGGTDPPLFVQMVVTQATYKPLEQQNPEAILAEADARSNQQEEFLRMLRERPLSEEEMEDRFRRRPPTWWERFRKRYLPF